MEFNYSIQPGQRLLQRGLVHNGKPLVSIITPFYNGGKYFEQTFNCVMNQSFPWFEWIIVDDGSTELTDLEILRTFAEKDLRIKVYHKKNSGSSSARNFGIRQAQTELILPLDCDDLIEPTFVEVCWWMLQKNPKAAWSYTDSVGFMGAEYLWQKNFDPEQEKTENLLTATALIRKQALEKIGLYDEREKHCHEDWIAWLKMIAQGEFPVQAGGEYLFWYRRSETGRYHLVENDKVIAAHNKEKLKEAADQIKDPKPPVLYPKSFYADYDTPQMTDWGDCIFADHKKIRIGLIIPWMVMGGADKFNLDLVAGLDKDRFEVGIITTIPSENPWNQRFRVHCADVFNLPNFVEPKDFAEFISYYIKSRGLDVLLISNSYIGAYLAPWLRQNFPNLVIIDYVHMEEWYYRNGGHARTSGALGGVLDRTYVCNNATRRVLLERYGRRPESVQTVHIGVDEVLFDRSYVEPGTLYKESGIAQGRPVVLFICRLHPQKRPLLMLEIALEVRKQIPDVAFAVVGDGEQSAELHARVKKMSLENTVYFLGEKEDVRPYYRDARVTLVCSLKEGLSLTAYESCSMGVPIVSADVGGQSDLVGEDVGALVPCLQDEANDLLEHEYSEQEVASYVQPLVRILTNDTLWERLSKAARKKIENEFTIRDMVNYFEQEFIRLCNDSRACAVRAKKAEALQVVAPMAADYYTMMAQAESWELCANRISEGSSRSNNGISWWKQKIKAVLRCWRDYGMKYTAKKIWKKISTVELK